MNYNDYQLNAKASFNNIDLDAETEENGESVLAVMKEIIEENGGEPLSPERIARVVSLVEMMNGNGLDDEFEKLADAVTEVSYEELIAEEVDFDYPESMGVDI